MVVDFDEDDGTVRAFDNDLFWGGGGQLESFCSPISLISHMLHVVIIGLGFDCDTKHFIIKSLTLSGGY